MLPTLLAHLLLLVSYKRQPRQHTSSSVAAGEHQLPVLPVVAVDTLLSSLSGGAVSYLHTPLGAQHGSHASSVLPV